MKQEKKLTNSKNGGGILNKNAFTLIELLAIIVILAIIAVITVPIILNIIENSRKGAAQDSAYGYKDAVNKYYATELSKPENQNLILNGQYDVSNGGVLDGNGISNKEIPVSGDKPSAGELHYTNNTLQGGCLVIGDYQVIFDGSSVSSTTKGDCSDYNFDEPTSFTPIVYRNNGGTISTTPSNDISSATDLNIGDYVKIGDTDGFYVLRKPISSDENVFLLSEYNISNTASVNETPTWRLDTSSYYDAIQYDSVLFSETFYWKEKFSVGPNCNSTYCPLYADEDVPFVYDSNSNLYAPMENYKNYLETITNLTLSIRPISASEFYAIEDYSWAFNGQVYWTGSAENGDNCWLGDHGATMYMDYDGFGIAYCNCDGSCEGIGIRPVIEITKSVFE